MNPIKSNVISRSLQVFNKEGLFICCLKIGWLIVFESSDYIIMIDLTVKKKHRKIFDYIKVEIEFQIDMVYVHDLDTNQLF